MDIQQPRHTGQSSCSDSGLHMEQVNACLVTEPSESAQCSGPIGTRSAMPPLMSHYLFIKLLRPLFSGAGAPGPTQRDNRYRQCRADGREVFAPVPQEPRADPVCGGTPIHSTERPFNVHSLTSTQLFNVK